MDPQNLLIVDIEAIPEGLDPDVWLKLIEEQNLVLWQSYNHKAGAKPQEPKMHSDGPYRIVNISTLNPDEREELFKSLNIEE